MCNAGIAFFFEVVSGTTPLLDDLRLMSQISNHEVERLILFDTLIKNEDRHIGNFLITLHSPVIMYFIDCSHFLICNGRLDCPIDLKKELLTEGFHEISILKNKKDNWYDILCRNVGYREEILYQEASRMKKILSSDMLALIQNDIPKEWKTESAEKRVDDVFKVIKARINALDEICNVIAEERREQAWKSY